jgi:hypothetical protein
MTRYSPAPKRAEVETISLRLPKYLSMAIRQHCEEHAADASVLGAQPPTISSVIRQLIEQQFGERARRLEKEALAESGRSRK